MRARKPQGVAIFRHKRAKHILACTIKSKGRREAGVRARLMRLSPEARLPILHAWAAGEEAVLPD